MAADGFDCSPAAVIVPDSEPDSEVAGTEAEPQPVREALEGR
ncbi:MAG: hypothetical protein ABS918_02625 [Saccharopolyspora rectivirgula]